MVSLGREGNNQVRGFSGGMKRRLSLAIAAVGDPQIILLDEPTTGLDPKVRAQVWGLI
jgi:ABC-2 type transport system ATP-binding protein